MAGPFAVKPGWQVVWDQPKCRTSKALLMTFGGKSEKNLKDQTKNNVFCFLFFVLNISEEHTLGKIRVERLSGKFPRQEGRPIKRQLLLVSVRGMKR